MSRNGMHPFYLESWIRYSQATGKVISGLNRKICSTREKTAIVLEMIKGNESMAAINKVRQGHDKVYGYRKVAGAVRAMDIMVNGKKVLRHLRSLRLTQPGKVKGLAWTRPALVKPGSANTYWEAGFTYVWAGDGNVYLCAIIDAWDRDIMGDVFSDRCRAIEAVQTLEKAVLYRFGGKVPESHHLTLRMDRGSQFRARRFREAARLLNVTLEYARVKCPEDNPYIESFTGSYKTEELYCHEYR